MWLFNNKVVDINHVTFKILQQNKYFLQSAFFMIVLIDKVGDVYVTRTKIIRFQDNYFFISVLKVLLILLHMF